MTQFCSQCGSELGENAKFCSYCGNTIASTPAPESRPAPQNQTYTQPRYVPTPQTQAYAQPQYVPPPPVQTPQYDKDRTVAGILALLVGGLGIHKFYMGAMGNGVMYLLFCWTGIPSIIGLIEGIMYLTESDKDFQERVKFL